MPEYRGNGLIDKLQDSVIEVAKSSRVIAISTSIETDNPRSLAVFGRMADRLGTSLEQIEQYNLTTDDSSVAPEVLYRITLDK